jgi:hypothetical protein
MPSGLIHLSAWKGCSPNFGLTEFSETQISVGIRTAGGEYPRLLLVVANSVLQYGHLNLRCASYSRQLPGPWMPFLLKTKVPSPPILWQCVTVAPSGKLPVSVGGPGGGPPLMTLASAGTAVIISIIAAIVNTKRMRFIDAPSLSQKAGLRSPACRTMLRPSHKEESLSKRGPCRCARALRAARHTLKRAA